MINDEINWVESGFKILVGASIAVGGWLWNRLVGAVVKNRDDLADHKLYVAENYIKKDVVERIHNRLDQMGENISDIKTLMVSTINGKHK